MMRARVLLALVLLGAGPTFAGPAPEAVYERFHNAISRGNAGEAANYAAAKIRPAVAGAKDRNGILKPLAPARYRHLATQIAQGERTAVVLIEAPYVIASNINAPNARGTILFVKEDGEWKILSALWQSNMQNPPRPQIGPLTR